MTYISDSGGNVIGDHINVSKSVALIESRILGKNMQASITPLPTGPPYIVTIDAFFANNSVIICDYTTISVPIEGDDDLLLTKSILAAPTPIDGVRNIRSFRDGEILVGKYDGSLRQQIFPPIEMLSMPRHEGFGVISGGTAVWDGNGGCTLSGGNAESVECGIVHGPDDTLVLRFAVTFTAGTSRLAFGDSIVGVGCIGGVFGITYTLGMIPHIYEMVAGGLANAVGDCIITLDGTILDTGTGTAKMVPWGFTEANRVAGSPLVVGMRKSRAYLRRIGIPVPLGVVGITNPCFYSSPTVVTRNDGDGTTWILSSAFNIDKMDGTGVLPVINPATDVIRGELIFTPRGEMMLMIANPNDGILMPVHRSNVSGMLYRGNQSRLNVYAPSGTVTISDLSMYSYGSRVGQKRTLETKTCWYTWAAGGVGRWWYIANILSTSSASRIFRVTVKTNYDGVVYLLTNTSAYLGGPEVSANGIHISTSSEVVTEFVLSQQSVISSTYSDPANRFYDVIMASSTPDSGGVATFESVSADPYTGMTVAIDGTFRGNLFMTIVVDYYV